ncbi:MAG TPA: hypothetical protein PKD09_17870 [Aggregatilinea sp.]|uniref:hypothetical protein n=1 Tax=Aggregatilinea sp. TaxID=2806333 RepID=UPI002D0F5AC7|nr:hypothetical protein [Aggregatilinea sp.]HML23529.1 hypothetical protein [Aggregatilinea sp.]
MSNEFWKSKKFAYTLAAVITALILALLPSVVTLDAESQQLLESMLPLVVLVFVLLITGHTVTDIAYAWANRPTNVPLPDALHDLIDAITGQAPTTNITVNTTSDDPAAVAKAVGEAVNRAQVPAPPREVNAGGEAVR